MKEKDKSLFQAPKPKKGLFADEGFGDFSDSLSLYDPTNPDINIFDSVDGELISLAGSQLMIYKYEQGEDFDDLYDEHRGKAIYQHPVITVGHYDPRPVEENLSEFGIELTNDQTFTFNLTNLDSVLGRRLRPGDVIKPKFQNLFYEVYEVQEDSFEIYGVFHLTVSAKLLRDAEKILPAGCFGVEATSFYRYDDIELEHTDGYKTEYDLTIPRLKSGRDTDGFSLIVFIHGSGGSKLNNSGIIEFAAKQGMAGVSIDCRGQGPSAELNNPTLYGHTNWDTREVLDVMEIIEHIVANNNIDPNRIGITGASQGGILSFALARFSEGTPESWIVNKGWRTSTEKYPKISAIAPSNWGGSLPDVLMPRGNFATNTVKNFWHAQAVSPIPWDPQGPPGQGVHYNPDTFKELEPFLGTNDPAGLTNLLNTDQSYKETYKDFSFVKTYPGHIHAFWAYDDAWGMGGSESTLLKAMQHSIPGFARWIHFGTGGHQTPRIQQENIWLKTIRLIFFESVFLGKMLPIPGTNRYGDFREYPSVRYGVVPNTIEEYQEDDDTKWNDRYVWDINNSQENGFGPGAANTYAPKTYYLDGNSLVDAEYPCLVNYEPHTIKHTVNYDFTYDDYYEILKNPEAAGGRGQGQWPIDKVLYSNNVSGNAPIMEEQTKVYNGPTLAYNLLMCGSPTAEIYVESEDPNFQVGFSLWEVNPQGEDRFITGGYQSITDHDPMKSYDGLPLKVRKLDIPFNLYTYKLEKGYTLNVKASVTSYSEPPYEGIDGVFRVPPLNESFEVKVLPCVQSGAKTLYSTVTVPLHHITGSPFLD